MCEHTEEPRNIKEYQFKGTWKFWIEDVSSREVVAAPDAGPIVDRGATGELMNPYLFSGFLQGE